MEAEVERYEGRVSRVGWTGTTRLSSKPQLDTTTLESDKARGLSYPLVIESAQAKCIGCDSYKYEADVEVLDAIPDIYTHRVDGQIECDIRLICTYDLKSTNYDGSSGFSNRPEIEFQALVLFREADDVQINVG